jgi:hypothetical protein
MSEVYLAEDQRLGRKLALKVLPERLTQDADPARRFDFEPQPGVVVGTVDYMKPVRNSVGGDGRLQRSHLFIVLVITQISALADALFGRVAT